jgi:hypothetical protein
MLQPCFSHLTATRISRAKEKYLEFIHQQHPEEDLLLSLHPQTASPPVNIALKSACAQPTPDFTWIALNAQFRWHAPHSIHWSRLVISAL